MKKLLITATAVLGLLIPSLAQSDIIFYKDGKVRGDVTSKEITLKLSSVSDDVIEINRDKTLGIKTYENGQLEVILKDTDMGYSSTPDCLKIVIRDDKGKEETLKGEDIKKYLFTNNVIPDKDIIKKYEFLEVASKYYKKIGLTPGDSFSLYRDDVKERYLLVVSDKLSLAKNYRHMHIISSFDKEEIQSLEEKLKTEGKDTYLAVVASAGCSLTPFFVKYHNSSFVEVVFHEWWHENKADMSLELNEATATAVGITCLEDFLSKHPKYKGYQYQKILKTSEGYSEYSQAVVEYYERLSKVYNSNLSDEDKLKSKEQILNEMREKTGLNMNNAELSFEIAYCRYFNLVNDVIHNYEDIKEAIKALKDIPSGELEEEKGIKYLEDLLKVKKEKPKLETYY